MSLRNEIYKWVYLTSTFIGLCHLRAGRIYLLPWLKGSWRRLGPLDQEAVGQLLTHDFDESPVELLQDGLRSFVDRVRQDDDATHGFVLVRPVQPKSGGFVHLEHSPDVVAARRRDVDEERRLPGAEVSLNFDDLAFQDCQGDQRGGCK